ncbi:MAG: hypothetical protein ACREDP_14050 [Bradyrhizobium sp.]
MPVAVARNYPEIPGCAAWTGTSTKDLAFGISMMKRKRETKTFVSIERFAMCRNMPVAFARRPQNAARRNSSARRFASFMPKISSQAAD